MMSMKHLIEQTQKAIATGGKTRYRIAKDTGADKGQLSRFMSGGFGLSIAMIERVLDYLGLEIVVQRKRKG
jgi:hypothetical protein